MSAYYNEFDRNAAAWLRELIKRGLIADGEVDERSIVDVVPADLTGFTQCHFFAGIGGWSYALRQAGWLDDRPVWTGSCPCQPFSVAGKGDGHADPRHLWPAWFDLIRQCRPPVVFGEQVEAAVRHGWLDLVQTDLEGVGYAFGAVHLPAAGVGAPHIRMRTWFVGESTEHGRQVRRDVHGAMRGEGFGEGCDVGRLADAAPRGLGIDRGASRNTGHAALGDATGRMADDDDEGLEGRRGAAKRADQCAAGATGVVERMADAGSGQLSQQERGSQGRDGAGSVGANDSHAADRPAPTHGFWANPDWIYCRDGKWRPIESGLEPLAHGVPARVVRLRGYGNAIVAPQAQAFIEAYLDT